MELWIRSQYGSLLEKAEAIKIANYDGTIGIVINNDYVFGEYKTKERAIEVLDEIQEAKLGNFHYRCNSNVKVSSKEDTIIYQMPEN